MQINEETNRLIADFADGERVFFLDINDEFLEDDGTLSERIMPDLLHPNQLGYAKWAAALRPILATLGFLERDVHGPAVSCRAVGMV